MTMSLFDAAQLEEIAARLDLREPNVRAVETLAFRLDAYGENSSTKPFEGVIDAATGVGKTYILAGAIEYFAAQGVRNFAVIAPGATILEKTVANFTSGHKKSLLQGMEVEPLVVTAENFNTPAMRAAMENPMKVKLFIFTVQSLLKPTSDSDRKTHKFQEGLGKAFYQHLEGLDDLIVFADEHHCYYGDAFSDAVRGLKPYAIVGLTATPHSKTPAEDIIFRYPLSAAIADKLVKTPVIVGRRDDRHDARTKLLDGIQLLEVKRKAVLRYCEETGAEPVNPVMLVVAQEIEQAEEVAALVESDDFLGGAYKGTVLTVHSKKTGKEKEADLAALDAVEELDSSVRIIVSVGMLKEGWDVKNVFVICSLRASVSDILTEQTLGRGLRLPFGAYTGWELLDTLEVIAHERYSDLLKKAKIINQAFIDFRTQPVIRKNAEGQDVATIEQVPVSINVAVEDELPAGEDAATSVIQGGGVLIAGVEERKEEAEQQASAKELVPRDDVPPLMLPRLRMTNVESHFSYADITDLSPFKQLGEKLADDPENELRRTRVDAVIVTGADGLKHTELVTGTTIEKIEASKIKLPLDQSRKALEDRVLTSGVGISRAGARKQLEPIVDSLIAGMGAEAETILSSYGERAAARVIEAIGREQRRFTAKPSYDEVVEVEQFAPVRAGRPVTTRDRAGAFKKNVGYEGWAKSLYEQAWFDSTPERDTALILDDASEIHYWARLQINDLPIVWEAGSYNPDLVAVDVEGTHWLIEVKSDKDLKTAEVQDKRQAAMRWANHVSADEKIGAKWRYVLASETDIAQANGSWTALKNLAAV